MLLTLFNIWWERRVVARMQHRIGPNVNGPFGLLQSLADGVKLALKEDLIPKAADKAVFLIAPVLAVIPAFVTFSVIPFGPVVGLPFTDRTTPLQLTDMPVAVLFVMAIASIGIYGIVLGGWSSGSTYSLLGGLRSSAQMISYEVAMGLALVAVFLYAGSMSTSEIVAAQNPEPEYWLGVIPIPTWYALILLPSFVIYVIAMVGETNRAPFDLPEAEGELVGGSTPSTPASSSRCSSSPSTSTWRRCRRSRRRCSSAAGTPRGRSSSCGRAPTPATGRCCGSSARCCCSSSCSSGCAGRCRGCATTSSWPSAGGG